MKKKNPVDTMSPLKMAHIWPEMAFGKNWEDVPITIGYELTEKGKRELARPKKRSRVIAYIITFVLLAIAYYVCFQLRIFG